jgi:hypothetical protein
MAFHRRDTVRTNDNNRRVNTQRGVVRILSVLVHRLLNPVALAAFTMGRLRGGPSWTGDSKEHISQTSRRTSSVCPPANEKEPLPRPEQGRQRQLVDQFLNVDAFVI